MSSTFDKIDPRDFTLYNTYTSSYIKLLNLKILGIIRGIFFYETSKITQYLKYNPYNIKSLYIRISNILYLCSFSV